MNRFHFPLRAPTTAAALTLALAMATPATEAAVVLTGNFVRADTSVSDLADVSAVVQGGAAFNDSARSQGLGSQGQLSLATASLDTVVDPAHGASGSGQASLALGNGASGEAFAVHQTFFEVRQRSSVTIGALFEAFGQGGSEAAVRLERMREDLNFIAEIFESDLDASPVLNFSTVLDPGFYLFGIGSTLRNGDPGEEGSNRFQFSLRFDELDDPNQVPEPATLALALAALWATRQVRRSGA